MASKFGIHVVGPRTGESIVVQLPDGGVGVIDSFADRYSPHPVVSWLRARFQKLDSLRFLAITHAHADHCFRAADIIDEFSPDELWLFQPFPAGEVLAYYRSLRTHKTRDAVEEAIGLPSGAVSDSLLRLRTRCSRLIRSGTGYRSLRTRSSFTIAGGQIETHFLTPCEKCQYRYNDEIATCSNRILGDGGLIDTGLRIADPDHNLASGAILLQYGLTRVLLMSDAERPRWEEWFATQDNAPLSRPVDFLKVSHHGSENGFHNDLYQRVCDPSATTAVIVPFGQGRVHLPMREGVDLIRPRVKELYCTNRFAAERSTGLIWEAPAPMPLPAIPAAWASQIRRARGLANLLVPEAGIPAPGGIAPALPSQWAADAHRSVQLWRLILPAFRQYSQTSVDPNMISAFYDDQGRLLELIPGEGTGRLA
jgi:beta-lactamase superfamily II metal-dependent hydrolase